jgi:hypothetical protein
LFRCEQRRPAELFRCERRRPAELFRCCSGTTGVARSVVSHRGQRLPALEPVLRGQSTLFTVN